MNKEGKLEKKNIQEIVDSIDTIMFGEKQNLRYGRLVKVGLKEPLIGATVGTIISGIIVASIPELDTSLIFSSMQLGLNTGVLVSLHRSGKSDYHEKIYKDAYLKLPREKQLEVLKLSRKLMMYYQEDIQNEKNKKYVENFLNLGDHSSMFNDFENNRDQSKISEKKDATEKKENLKMTEGYIVPIEYVEFKPRNLIKELNKGYTKQRAV